MHPIPLVMALALALGSVEGLARAEEKDTPVFSGTGPLSTTSVPHKSVPIPESCKGMIEQAKWDVMPTWQRAYFQNAVLSPKWRTEQGITESLWERYIPTKKGLMVMKGLQQETDNRFDVELDRLYVQMAHYEDDREKGKPMTVAQRLDFAKAALDLETEYPGSNPSKDRVTNLALVREKGARYELEAEYLLSHKADATLSARLKAIRDAGHADKKALDNLFDNPAPAAPILGAGLPGAPPGARLPPKPLMSPKGASSARHTTGGVSSASELPMQPKIRFEAEAPKEKVRADIWFAANGAATEKRFYDKVMKGLVTPTETAVLDRLARNQLLYDQTRDTRVAKIDEDIKIYEAEVLRLSKERNSEARALTYQTAIRDRKKEKQRLLKNSSEVIVSFRDLDDAAGTAVWDTQPAADGKVHLRMNFDRKMALDATMKERSTHEYAMKIFTHEYSHDADFADPGGMIWGLTERSAYLAGARAWAEEGGPNGYWEVQSEGHKAAAIKRDPIVWTTNHLTTSNYVPRSNLWLYVTPDDLFDPEAGLRWRLKVAYDYATRLDHPSADEKAHAKQTEENLKHLDLGDALTGEIAQIYLDKTIPGNRKADAFADSAAKLPVSRDWVKSVIATPVAEADRLKKAYKVYWMDLGAFYLSK